MRILVGPFYEIIEDSNGKIKAKCKNCSTIICGSATSSGNFRSHYEKKHDSKLNDDLKAYLFRAKPLKIETEMCCYKKCVDIEQRCELLTRE